MYVVCFVIVCLCNAEAQDAYSEGGSPHKSIVSDDADELYGDSIDEDTQSVKPLVDTAPAPSTSGELHLQAVSVGRPQSHHHTLTCTEPAWVFLDHIHCLPALLSLTSLPCL